MKDLLCNLLEQRRSEVHLRDAFSDITQVLKTQSIAEVRNLGTGSLHNGVKRRCSGSFFEEGIMSESMMKVVTEEIFAVWFLIGAAFVFWMQAGFAMCEAGFTRAKNAGNPIGRMSVRRSAWKIRVTDALIHGS